MGAASRIYKNTAYLGTAEIVARFLQFIVMLYAARILSKEHFGIFNFALAISFIAIILADLGLFTLLVREISRNKNLAAKYFVNAFLIKIVFSFVTYLLIIVFLNILNYPPYTRKIVYIIWFYSIISTFTHLVLSLFRAFEKMIYDAFLKILRMVILTSAGLYILFKGYGLVVFSYAFVFAEILVLIIGLFIALTKFIELKLAVDFMFIKSIVKKALPFGLAFVFSSIYFFIGSVILSKVKGDLEVGIYSAAYNLAFALMFIPTVYINAIYPVLSRYYKESKTELKMLYEKSFKYLYIIGIPISAGIFVLADDIIFFLYGSKYSASVIALQIISLFLFLKFINFLFGIVLSSIDKQNKRMLSQGLTAVFNVLLNAVLIPIMGFVGAALATFVTEVFLFITYYMFVSKNWYFYNFTKILLKPLIAVLGMVLFIRFTGFGLIMTILLSSIVYFAALLILKTLDKEDYVIIRKMFKNEV